MYLLDTNALIWTLTKPEMLTDHALDIITNTDNKLYTSDTIIPLYNIKTLWK